jgi:hypothetical protein
MVVMAIVPSARKEVSGLVADRWLLRASAEGLGFRGDNSIVLYSCLQYLTSLTTVGALPLGTGHDKRKWHRSTNLEMIPNPRSNATSTLIYVNFYVHYPPLPLLTFPLWKQNLRPT